MITVHTLSCEQRTNIVHALLHSVIIISLRIIHYRIPYNTDVYSVS